jgi:tRNA (adenine-N(1)-)-methyltransferase non-catalytic subunit
MFNVCQYWFDKDPNRVLFLRPDALAQMITLANVRSGRRFLIVDGSGGLILAAVLDRLAGMLSSILSPTEINIA